MGDGSIEVSDPQAEVVERRNVHLGVGRGGSSENRLAQSGCQGQLFAEGIGLQIRV